MVTLLLLMNSIKMKISNGLTFLISLGFWEIHLQVSLEVEALWLIKLHMECLTYITNFFIANVRQDHGICQLLKVLL